MNLMNIIVACNDILTLGLGICFGGGKYIWYNGCFISHFSASTFVEPDALDSLCIVVFLLQYPSLEQQICLNLLNIILII